MNVSIFSSNPELRRKWMGDTSPEMSLKAFEIFSQNIDVNASSVVIPDVNDLEESISNRKHSGRMGCKNISFT